MNKIKNSFIIALALVFTFVISCKDLDELNINPNGVDPEKADLNLLLPTIVTGVGQYVVSLGFDRFSGVMQHTQKDGWSGNHNDYDWDNSSTSWSGYYSILRNNDEYYKKAIEGENEFHQGVALVMKAYTFGLITDLWGDAPYLEALKADLGEEFFKPVFDSQKDIYTGILADLETANTLLSKSSDSYSNISPSQDVLYNGDVTKWRKFANSLALRYYMRLSLKEPGVAEQGIRNIASNPGTYPLITSAADDATVSYIGLSPADSWPTNTVFNPDPSGTYMRLKLCATLVDVLQDLNDPRLGVWANKIETPLELVDGENIDQIIGGVRQISQDIVDAYELSWSLGVDYDPEYVGIPPSVFAAPQYNLNPNLDQGVFNPHASHLNDIYKESAGSLLLMRIMSAAEVHFILAEAALYGWASGTPEGHYAVGIEQSFNAWGVGDAFGNYIDGAPYSGLESIIEQKWIASWTAAAESWFDYRRTGLPDLQTGESAKRAALPLRFYYHYDDEIAKNTVNAEAAIEKLEPTAFKGNDISNNSAWSKTWLLQGTGKPY
ncbi:MAG: SusD/RagB family nutrient-binding outer membrane lipoprotein [Prolixibacteraceae bacterium]|nr:SusD/RagB family nutrient-binding outer membrane lipoprotein [Prolixibacteraceae bacterium]MBT6762902.1 SusD/RagB family nutrient-binding outer membrane lipoprotein [Prolixibacteraceae bacterium]MBT7396120.1 SusD/RagB family nutrient-binding outer membrane lipoprotein [Prolixibacteraceae bacterium]